MVNMFCQLPWSVTLCYDNLRPSFLIIIIKAVSDLAGASGSVLLFISQGAYTFSLLKGHEGL
jgi:hypothetical protein